MTFDVDTYSITVRKEKTADGDFFVGRVAELPDVISVGEDYHEAYEMVRNVVADLHDAAIKENRLFPGPLEVKSDEYSGRITLRIPVTLHHGIATWADDEGVSINHVISSTLSAAVATRSFSQAVNSYSADLAKTINIFNAGSAVATENFVHEARIPGSKTGLPFISSRAFTPSVSGEHTQW